MWALTKGAVFSDEQLTEFGIVPISLAYTGQLCAYSQRISNPDPTGVVGTVLSNVEDRGNLLAFV